MSYDLKSSCKLYSNLSNNVLHVQQSKQDVRLSVLSKQNVHLSVILRKEIIEGYDVNLQMCWASRFMLKGKETF